MSTRRTVILYCDYVNCDRTAEAELDADPKSVPFVGWVRRGGDDLCPEHAESDPQMPLFTAD